MVYVFLINMSAGFQCSNRSLDKCKHGDIINTDILGCKCFVDGDMLLRNVLNCTMGHCS